MSCVNTLYGPHIALWTFLIAQKFVVCPGKRSLAYSANTDLPEHSQNRPILRRIFSWFFKFRVIQVISFHCIKMVEKIINVLIQGPLGFFYTFISWKPTCRYIPWHSFHFSNSLCLLPVHHCSHPYKHSTEGPPQARTVFLKPWLSMSYMLNSDSSVNHVLMPSTELCC